MTVYAITDTKKGRTGIAPTYLQTTQEILQQRLEKRSFKQIDKKLRHGLFSLFMITVSRSTAVTDLIKRQLSQQSAVAELLV